MKATHDKRLLDNRATQDATIAIATAARRKVDCSPGTLVCNTGASRLLPIKSQGVPGMITTDYTSMSIGRR